MTGHIVQLDVLRGAHMARGILLAWADARERKGFARRLEARGYLVHAVGSGESVLDLLQAQSWPTAIIDADMPDRSGRDIVLILQYLWSNRHDKPPVRLILASSYTIPNQEWQRLGVARYLRKPVDFDTLAGAISVGLKDKQK